MHLKITADYLHLPVNRTAESVACRFHLDGALVRYFDCRPCPPEEADFFACYSVKEFRGRDLTVTAAANTLPAAFASWLRQSDTPPAPNDATEALRPQLHFSSRRGWLNDPNGLFFYDGQYHLFYQHNPFSVDWGNMHWGHAVSPDLLHWTELDDVLYPDAAGSIFSGSAVVDVNNDSGLGVAPHPPILLFYTAAGSCAPTSTAFTQCLAVSTDGGVTFQKYAGNPVIPWLAGENRDPKVVRDLEGGRWLLALYLEKRGDEHVFGLLESHNLLEWNKFQELTLPGTGECPDLFELPVDGDSGHRRWVFSAADGKYRVGHFATHQFVGDSGPHEFFCRQGGGNPYAAQTWDNVPDGRRLQIGWHLGAIPSPRFNMSMALPVELTLKSFADGIRLCAAPVAELRQLRTGKEVVWQNFELADFAEDRTAAVELGEVELEFTASQPVTLAINGAELVCDPAAGEIRFCNAVHRQATSRNHFRLHLVIDRTSVELFADDGRIYLCKRVLFTPENRAVRLAGAAATVATYAIRELRSIWIP
jgi:sucrose-6-phosphate hydrolase SacC (GH32 family)